MPCNKRAALFIAFFFCVASGVQSSDNASLVYRKKYIMGTVFEIAAYEEPSNNASKSIDKAFREIVRIDDLLSNYKPHSALSNLNHSAHYHAVRVPADLYRVIDQAVGFSKTSEGEFDITVGPLVDLWKSALSGGRVPTPGEQQQAQGCVGYEKIALTPPDEIIFHSPCLQIDLGGIGKGFAADKAAEVLHASGIRNALINAGGSTMLAMGAPPGQTAWVVHLRDPSQKHDPYVMLKDESVSTSEQTPASLLEHDSPGHIIDPQTGTPLKTEFAVSAIANTATISDGLSTTLLLLGPAQGKSLISRMPGVSAIWISPKAQIETMSSGPQILFKKKL